ncbi:hypothetical protein VTP01DRAFT_4584 [Rhizomucor pusillus]|uniref:uncharacterized protein n=1 Tax=Rhizomucor pusillus TaxID=4840 RepID=UPI003742C95D
MSSRSRDCSSIGGSSSMVGTAAEEEDPTVIHHPAAEDNAAEKDALKEIDQDDDGLRNKKQILVKVLLFFGLQLSLFLSVLDETIVATTLPKIGSDFQAMTISSWIANSYILAFDSTQPIFSKLADIFGRKAVLLTGIAIFLFGSVLCGAAQNMIWLIVCRAVQGIGGGGVFSMVFVVIADLVPLKKRGTYQGLTNAVFALGGVCGPLIGGALTDNATWRWNFYINLPLGGFAFAIMIIFLRLPMEHENMKQKFKRIDYLGNLLCLAATVLFLLALNFGGQTFPWGSAAVIAPLVLTGVLFGVLVFVEIKVAKEPLFPPRLFLLRSVVALSLLNLFSGIVFFGVVYYLPIYFQIVRGNSATWSGIRLIPMQLLISVFSTLTGVAISKFAVYRSVTWYGTAIVTLALGLFQLFQTNTDWSLIYGLTVLLGAGQGAVFSGTFIAMQAAVEPRDIAVALGLTNFVRVLGGALGIAVASATLNSTLHEDLPSVIPLEYISDVLEYPESLRTILPADYVQPVIEIYVRALHIVWYVLTAMSAASFVCSLAVKYHPFNQHESKQEQQEDISEQSDHHSAINVNTQNQDKQHSDR